MLTVTLIISAIFVGFYLFLVRPLQKKHRVDKEFDPSSRMDEQDNDPTRDFLAGNAFYHDHHEES